MNKRKWLLTSTFLFLLLQVFVWVDTFGLFEIAVEAPSAVDLAAWQIKVNTQDISGEFTSFMIPSINWQANNNVMPGKAAPGNTAYFEILIDPRGTEVSIEYEISMDFANLNNEKIYITSVKNKAGDDLDLNDEDNYVGTMFLADVINNQTEIIKVEFIWENDEDNNEIDSSFVGISDGFLDVPISIKVSQYVE